MGANTRYICVARADIPRGTLQVLDLQPNTSLKDRLYDPPSQSKYLNRVTSDSVATVGTTPVATRADYRGLAAYLIDHIEAGGLAAGTAAFTAAQANTAAAAIIAEVDAGNALTLADINTVLAGVVADTELTSGGGSASTGSVEEVLRILAGGEYLLPAGSSVDSDGSTFVAAVAGSFVESDRETLETSSFLLSNDSGQLATLKGATFSYGGTAGAAVVIYDNTGALVA